MVLGLAVAVDSAPPFGCMEIKPPAVAVVPLLSSPDTVTDV